MAQHDNRGRQQGGRQQESYSQSPRQQWDQEDGRSMGGQNPYRSGQGPYDDGGREWRGGSSSSGPYGQDRSYENRSYLSDPSYYPSERREAYHPGRAMGPRGSYGQNPYGQMGGYYDPDPMRDQRSFGFDPGYESQGDWGSRSGPSQGNYGDDYGQRSQQGYNRGYGQGQGQSQGGRGQQREEFEPDYNQWRQEQLQSLDDDYRQWRSDRFQKFSDEFSNWRSSRPKDNSAKGNNPSESSGAGGNKGNKEQQQR